MMNEHAYFHWDLLRQPLQTSQFGMGAPFFDVNSILELRKEKSRDAARSRRGKENYEFYELAKLLPLPAAITSQLDKASIIRLTISYLKLRDFSCHGDPQWTPEGGISVNKLSKSHQSRLDIIDPFESRQGTHILQSLDGFAFILASDGRFLYISETVSIYLGLSQVEMAGSSVFEYVHPQDHTELAEQLGMCMVPIGSNRSPHGSGSEDGSSPATPRPGSPIEKGYMMVHDPDKSTHKSFSLRMKSTLTKRGVHVKTSGYRVIHVLGSLRPQSAFGLSRTGGQSNNGNANPSTNSGNSSSMEPPLLLGFVGMAIALPPPTITELRLELDTFITKMSADFKVIYCEPVISDLMDLSVDDITDRLLYDLCHAADLKNLRRSHLDILNKGQALTDYYRLMNRHGGYIWVQTCATTLLNNKNSDDQSILGINYVVSAVESNSCALDLWQLTGDATSSMSSASNSQSREDKLKELRAKKTSVASSTKSKGHSPRIQNASSSPNTSPSDSSKVECKTSGTSSPKLPPDNSGEDTGASSPEKSAGNVDIKNKRRKMENPRKRKRSNCDTQSMDQDDKALNLTRSGVKSSVISRTPQSFTSDYQNLEKNMNDRKVDSSALAVPADNVTSSSPEDLSVKRSARGLNDRNIIQHSSNVSKASSSSSSKQKGSSFFNVQDSPSPNQLCITGSSVKELEAAMNRHLPASSSSAAFPSQNERHSFENVLVDSTGAIKGFTGISNPGVTATNSQPSSTSWLSSTRGTGSEMLTASNILRSLYANRESVIKTNSRTQSSFLNSDPPTSLLTPPEQDPTTYRDPNILYSYAKSDFSGHSHMYNKDIGLEPKDHLYKDQTSRDQFTIIPYKDHIPTAYIDHISSAVYKDHITSTYKELSPYKDIIPAFTIPSLMSPTGRMHQAYPSFHHHFTVPISTTAMDACSITPPSSNSPDTNKHISSNQQFEGIPYSTDHVSACNLSHKQLINASLAPSGSIQTSSSQHYHHSRHHRDYFYQGVSAVDAAKSGYYGVSSSSTGAMYADLNQNGSGSTQYETCTRPVLPWY